MNGLLAATFTFPPYTEALLGRILILNNKIGCLKASQRFTSHSVEDSDDNGGNEELMEFDWNACFYMLCMSTIMTAPTSREGKISMTHGISTLRGQEGIITSAVSHGGSEASRTAGPLG